MARLFTSGFEFNSNTAGVEFTAISGAPTITTTSPRSGTYCGAITSLTAFTSKTWEYDFRAADGSVDMYVRTYLNITTLPDVDCVIGGFIDTVGNVSSPLLLTTTGTLKMKDNAGTVIATSSVLSTGTQYRIEHRQFNTSTTLELKIDGVSIGASTTASTSTYFGYVWGGNVAGLSGTTTISIAFDDLAINDTSGTSQTGYPGSGKVLRLKPSAAGDVNTFATQTGGTAGAANNFTRVNEVTPDDATTFNGSSTLNEEDLFNMADSGVGASDTVNLVQVWGRFRNSTADATAKVTFEIEKTGSGTKTSSTAITPNSTTWRTNVAGSTIPKTAPITAYTDPDGAAWTQTTLDSMQAGYKLTTAPGTAGRRIDVTSVSAIVDYTPASITPPSSVTYITYRPPWGS